MRVPDTAEKGKMWRFLGKILKQTAGKDSYIIQLDSGDQIRHHKRFLRLEPTIKGAYQDIPNTSSYEVRMEGGPEHISIP